MCALYVYILFGTFALICFLLALLMNEWMNKRKGSRGMFPSDHYSITADIHPADIRYPPDIRFPLDFLIRLPPGISNCRPEFIPPGTFQEDRTHTVAWIPLHSPETFPVNQIWTFKFRELSRWINLISTLALQIWQLNILKYKVNLWRRLCSQLKINNLCHTSNLNSFCQDVGKFTGKSNVLDYSVVAAPTVTLNAAMDQR